MTGLEGDNGRGSGGIGMSNARECIRGRATERDDEIDHIIEVGVVVDARLPGLIGRARVGERYQREEDQAKQWNEGEPVPHAH